MPNLTENYCGKKLQHYSNNSLKLKHHQVSKVCRIYTLDPHASKLYTPVNSFAMEQKSWKCRLGLYLHEHEAWLRPVFQSWSSQRHELDMRSLAIYMHELIPSNSHVSAKSLFSSNSESSVLHSRSPSCDPKIGSLSTIQHMPPTRFLPRPRRPRHPRHCRFQAG